MRKSGRRGTRERSRTRPWRNSRILDGQGPQAGWHSLECRTVSPSKYRIRLPRPTTPKFVAGLSSHDCTSATICDELHVYTPTVPTDWLALTVAEKSPLGSSKKGIKETVPPCGIVGRGWRSIAFLPRQGPRRFLLPSLRAACAARHFEEYLSQFSTCSGSKSPLESLSLRECFQRCRRQARPGRSSPWAVSPAKKWLPSALLWSPSAGSNS